MRPENAAGTGKLKCKDIIKNPRNDQNIFTGRQTQAPAGPGPLIPEDHFLDFGVNALDYPGEFLFGVVPE